MKKISLLLLVICLKATLFATTNSAIPPILDQLIELNKYWEGKEMGNKEQALLTNETELIQLHLNLVIEQLKNKNINQLNIEQRNNRNYLLAQLKDYSDAGIFPINSFHYTATPYFIDEVGTACAVGQLIIESGHATLAKSISEKYNYLYIENMPQESIEKWAFEFGFTVAELKWIQPAYGPQCQPGQVINPICSSGQKSSGCFNPDWQSDSLIQPITYFTEYNDGNGWVDDSVNLWQFGGAVAGQYKVTITDSTGRTKLYNYTIVAPPAIASNDSVISHASSQTACNGSLKVTPSNGVAPYQISIMNQSLTYSDFNANGIFDSLCPAVYTIVIYDANYCQTVDSANILFSTGIAKTTLGNYMNFQNPISNNQLELTTNLNGIKQLQIYDLSGKLVFEKAFNHSIINTELDIENGLYLLQITTKDLQIQKKLIITQ